LSGDILPFVSAMLVMRNEEAFIKGALGSLLQQDYPFDRFEILVIDGMSDDASISMAEETVKEHKSRHGGISPEVRYFQNPDKLLAAGWNLGIKESKGDLLVRIDAHAAAERDFISSAVRVMQQQPQASCVGGVLTSMPSSPEGELVAHALSSPFGVGNSRFRISGKPGVVDTVAFGLYRKEIFQLAGPFNESLRRNQDNDMHGRIRDAGGIFWFDPSIRSTYFTRGTVRGMMKQAFGNGKWNAVLLRKRPQALSLRHLIPFFFVCSLILLILLTILHPIFGWLCLAALLMHLSLGVYFALKKVRGIKRVLTLYGIFLLLHLSYGTGTTLGLLSPLPKGVR
jgi:glycosyltransferase involved in cell wall biosynthesis